LTEITCDIFVRIVGVWKRDFLDLWCVCLVRQVEYYCSTVVLNSTDYAHKNITSNFSQARSTLPEDGSI